uniref:Uncharacterized protein n=1 Tax=Glossina palpalis gambiensis TaxID=67801 RepID=A0A1B0B002_9MUSC
MYLFTAISQSIINGAGEMFDMTATLSTLLACLPLAIWAFPINLNIYLMYISKYCNKSVHNGGSCFHASVKLIVKREKKDKWKRMNAH